MSRLPKPHCCPELVSISNTGRRNPTAVGLRPITFLESHNCAYFTIAAATGIHQSKLAALKCPVLLLVH